MPAEPVHSLGDWIRRRRKKLDLTQQGLADRVHCSVNTIKKIETDSRRPSKQLADLLASQLDVPEEHRPLFLDVARGIRSVDSLERLTQPSEPQHHRFNLDLIPAPVSSIIGREFELDAVMRILGEARLVTITGSGGVGKSTLAKAVANECQKRGERSVYIPLVGLNSADHIPFAIAFALGLDITPNSDVQRQIFSYLANKRILLVLDNFEHLLDGAPILGLILQATSEVNLLVTSRERLKMSEEQNYPLQGLRYPEEDSISGDLSVYPAIKLFVERVRKINPNFVPDDTKSIIQICRLTEGLPLALEMVASWMDVTLLKDAVSGLSRSIDLLAHKGVQVDARHRSMQAVFDTSWQMLDREERDVFTRLCVLRGGFTRQASEAVANGGIPVLSTLVGRSMVKFDYARGRYSIHELLRLFGEEYLKGTKMLGKTQQEHAEYFLEQAETALVALHSAAQEEWFDVLDAEQDNLRAGMTHLFSNVNQKDTACRMVLALCWYWRIRSRVVEARGWVVKAIRTEPNSIEIRAALHYHAGHFGWMQGDYDFARSHQLASLALWHSMGSAGINGAAYSHQSLGMIAEHENDLDAAIEHQNTSIRLYRASNDAWGEAFARHRLGSVFLSRGKIEEAEGQFQHCERYFRECGDRWALGLALGYIAWIEYRKGNFARARALAEETRIIREDLGHIHSVIDIITLLAQIALDQNDKEAGRQLLESAIELSNELGNQQFLTDFKNQLASLNAETE